MVCWKIRNVFQVVTIDDCKQILKVTNKQREHESVSYINLLQRMNESNLTNVIK